MRQAQESEIIRLSMHVRQGLPISDFEAAGAQVQIFKKSQIVSGMYEWADQILCATNTTRTAINNFVRQQRGYQSTPQIGDKIISLRNHWDDFSLSGNWALTNGAIGTITNFQNDYFYLPPWIGSGKVDVMKTSFSLDDNDKFIDIPIDYQCMISGNPTLTPKQIYQLNRNKKLPDAPYEFAYAYAITTWKAQGSEWDKVLGFEEKFPYDVDTHKRFLYTMITRAKEKLVIIAK